MIWISVKAARRRGVISVLCRFLCFLDGRVKHKNKCLIKDSGDFWMARLTVSNRFFLNSGESFHPGFFFRHSTIYLLSHSRQRFLPFLNGLSFSDAPHFLQTPEIRWGRCAMTFSHSAHSHRSGSYLWIKLVLSQ